VKENTKLAILLAIFVVIGSFVVIDSSLNAPIENESRGILNAREDVGWQLGKIKKHFPNITPPSFKEIGGVVLNKTLDEGWIAIPKWQMIDSTYAGAIKKLIAAIKSEYGFEIVVVGAEIDILKNAKNRSRWDRLSKKQNGDFIIVSYAMTRSFCEHDTSLVIEQISANEQFALFGTYETLVLLLAHYGQPILPVSPELVIIARGDEWVPMTAEEKAVKGRPVFIRMIPNKNQYQFGRCHSTKQ